MKLHHDRVQRRALLLAMSKPRFLLPQYTFILFSFRG